MNPQEQNEIAALRAQVEELGKKLAAREKTVRVLTNRAMEKQGNRVSSFTLLTENSSLQEVVARKTVELEEQNHKLEEAHQALKHAQSELLQAQKMESIGRLAAGVAHEINTPIQYVSDNVHFIKDTFPKIQRLYELTNKLLECPTVVASGCDTLKTLNQDFQRLGITAAINEIPAALDDAIEGALRVSKIVKAMKEFSHPGTKEKTIADINQAILTTVAVTRNEWKYLCELDTILDEKLPKVPCYLSEFNQCVLNLIINAVHAIEDRLTAEGKKETEKGKITIQTGVSGHFLEVRVSDSGCGIPEAIRNQIFEPFFTTKPPGKGTGQGLTFVYSIIVKKHKGSIELESEVGKGTTFILKLPIPDTI